MRRLLLHSWYPLFFQALATLLLAVSLYYLFTGPPNDEYNPGSYLIWYLWWAALPLTFLLVGRMWCAVCPIGLFSDALQKVIPWKMEWPGILKRLDLTLLTAALVATHFLNLWFNFEENLVAGRTFVVVLIGFALATALLSRRRVWCRSLCPVGALGGLMSRVSALRLQNNPDKCSRCSGTPCLDSCPLLENPRDGIDMPFCVVCGDCLKACPHESCSAALLPGAAQGGPTPHPYQSAAAALVLLGVALDMALRHLTDWPIAFWKSTSALGIAPTAGVELIVHAAVVAFPLLLACTLAAAGGSPHPFGRRLENLSHALLPLGVMAVAALALRPLLVVGPLNLKGILLSAGFRGFRWLGASRYLEGWPLTGMQWALMGLGLFLCWRTVRNIRREEAPPGRIFLITAAAAAVFFGVLFFWVFTQPMVN